jgi:hypothetical protein
LAPNATPRSRPTSSPKLATFHRRVLRSWEVADVTTTFIENISSEHPSSRQVTVNVPESRKVHWNSRTLSRSSKLMASTETPS